MYVPVFEFQSTVSPLRALPDPPVTFHRAQFRLGVRRHGAPGGFGAESHRGAGGSLWGAETARDPEVFDAAVHPGLEGPPHQLGSALRLLGRRLSGGQLQHGAQLLEALVQVQVAWGACVEPAVLFWRGFEDKEKLKMGTYI